MSYTIEIYKLDPSDGSFSRIDEIITFQDLNYFNKLNGVGGAAFTLALQDPKTTRENLVRFRNQVIIKRDDTIVWFGPITNIDGDYADVDGKIQVQCQSYLYHLKSRQTDKLKLYVQEDQTDIAWDLIDDSQSRTNGDLGIVEGNTASASVDRDRTYEYKDVSDALTDLSNVRQGIDFDFTASTDVNGLFTGVQFNTYYPGKGQLRDDLNYLELGINVKKIAFRTDRDMVNSVIYEGAGTGDAVLSTPLDYDGSQIAYSRREAVQSDKDVSILETLVEKAQKFLDLRSVENYVIDIEMEPNKNPQLGDYILGDILRLNLVKENTYINFTGEARVVEIAVKVDQQGVDFVTPKLQLFN